MKKKSKLKAGNKMILRLGGIILNSAAANS